MNIFRLIFAFCLFAPMANHASDFSLREETLRLKEVDLSQALFQGPLYPQVEWSKVDLQKVATRDHRAWIMENEYLRLVILRDSGRVYSLTSRLTGHNQLWTNAIARPIHAHNDTGWWHVFGGIEYTIPRGEHGTTWALKWNSSVVEDSPSRKCVQMTVIEPGTGLEQSLSISLYPGRLFCQTGHSVRNSTTTNAFFSHWMNPMLAPGGRNEVTPKTEMIVPCTAMTVPPRDFNKWMLGATTQPFEDNPLRWMEHWAAPGDLLVERLTADFYGAFCHEENEGVVRLFNRQITPGMDIWTWGFPPPPDRQREYSLTPNLGYIEMWGGTATNYTDEARQKLAPGQSISWTEYLAPFHGTRGLTYADTNAVLNFTWDPKAQKIEFGLHPLIKSRARIKIEQNGRKVYSRRARLTPSKPVYETLQGQGSVAPVLEIAFDRAKPLRLEAKVLRPVRFGNPYPPKP